MWLEFIVSYDFDTIAGFDLDMVNDMVRRLVQSQCVDPVWYTRFRLSCLHSTGMTPTVIRHRSAYRLINGIYT